MTEKKLGKITRATLGTGGYQDAMFGLTVQLSVGGDGGTVSDFKGNWASYPKSGAQYSEEDWRDQHAETYDLIRQLMKDAKKDDFSKLVGVPVEIEFNGMAMAGWRVLTEVL